MSEVGNVLPYRGFDAGIVRRRLTPAILYSVYPSNFVRKERANGGLGFVGAIVAHYQELEVPIRLLHHRTNRGQDMTPPVIGRHDH